MSVLRRGLHPNRSEPRIAPLRAESLSQRLQKTLKLSIEGESVFFNGLLVKATRGNARQSTTTLILSDYVGSQHRLLLEKLNRTGFVTHEIQWGGELELTLKNSRIVVASLNNCSGFIHEVLIPRSQANPLEYGREGYPEVAFTSEEHLTSFLSRSFPDLINHKTRVYPYSKQEEHLMKVEGVDSFNPKHIDATQSLSFLLYLYSPNSLEALHRMLDVIRQDGLFEYFDSIIKNMIVTKRAVKGWNKNVEIYNEFKKNYLLFNDVYTAQDVRSFLSDTSNWQKFIASIQSITTRAYRNPDARFLMLSVTDSALPLSFEQMER